MNNFLLEIATTDFESTKNAVAGGADRIELCANLGEGGTTQSFGVIKNCREKFSTKIYPIIRIRGGDFYYTEEEYACMYHDAMNCKELGCDGVVIGFLNQNATIDVERTARIVEAVSPLGVTFHRAFDRCLDPFQALEQLIQIGCERILTSGQKLTAPEGVGLITALNKVANHRIIIMPGSGVRESNIQMLAQQTGCHEFHTSLRALQHSPMQYFPEAFEQNEENNHFSVEANAVSRLKNLLHQS
ncbi:MAG TPA: copper homeostasis protein CutC [Niabella sp.]|nr:copper homeostasis protein CutC [Niabella sp.]HOZ95721.1 copper homeostasis protein CutC [Niabella sp.]HQW15964.1 copper homeostasis protein CutC [Niabella sp.]HQX21183.1 copper homeostasis protein CutC [Niabella sp.]HQX40726.1 copper homeostasis protein CutC [Niabella sp.]